MNDLTESFEDMTKVALSNKDVSNALPSIRDVKHLEYMAIEEYDMHSVFRIIKIFKEHPAVNRFQSTAEKVHAINLISKAYYKLQEIYGQ